MLNEKLNNVDEQLLVSIYKTLEVYDTIKNTRLRIDNKIISTLDKKYLSLLLGIYFKKNEVSKILNLLRYDYGIQVYTSRKPEEEYVNIYENNFKDILDSLLDEDGIGIEEFMLKLIDVDFIKWIHHSKGLSLIPVKLILSKSVQEKEKPKTLQKK